jgi:hypothetical protein
MNPILDTSFVMEALSYKPGTIVEERNELNFGPTESYR